jgi:hypothetical protein
MAHNGIEDIHRLRSHDVELGISDVLNKHVARHAAHQKPVSQRRLDLEHYRPALLREMCAEATGVFFYGRYLQAIAGHRLTVGSLSWHRCNGRLRSYTQFHAGAGKHLYHRSCLRLWHCVCYNSRCKRQWRSFQSSPFSQAHPFYSAYCRVRLLR